MAVIATGLCRMHMFKSLLMMQCMHVMRDHTCCTREKGRKQLWGLYMVRSDHNHASVPEVWEHRNEIGSNGVLVIYVETYIYLYIYIIYTYINIHKHIFMFPL